MSQAINVAAWFGAMALVLIGFSPLLYAEDTEPPLLSKAESPSPLEAKIAELEKRIKELEGANCVGAPKLAPFVPQGDIVPAVYGETENQSKETEKKESADKTDKDKSDKDKSEKKDGDSTSQSTSGIPSFSIQSADKKNKLRITGQIQADYRDYPRHRDYTDIDTFLVRRARLGIEADVFDHYEFRFLPDFGNNQTLIQDAFMNVHYWDEFMFEVGKFKEPVSYEQLIQDRYVPTLERSLIDQITPQRDIGLMVHGRKLLNDHFDYAVGVFNGEPNGNGSDTNKNRDFAGRIAYRPFNDPSMPEYLQQLQIGISGSGGKELEPLTFNNSSTTPMTLRTPGNIPWLTFKSTVRADGDRSRTTPEISYFLKGFGFATQYIRMDQNLRAGAPATVNKVAVGDPIQDIRFEGYYFLATYLLTGEKRTPYGQAIDPIRPFDLRHPCSNPGAWELVARFSHLQVDPSIFDPANASGNYQLANPVGNSRAATELTLGFNWYLNSLIRVQFNWEHSWFQQALLLPTSSFKELDAMLVRFQYVF